MKTTKNAFALAAAGLMSATNISTVSAADWSHEVNTFNYQESDSRVTDKSIKYAGKGSFNDGDTVLNLNLGVDILTGASPTGALPADGTSTIVTSPSGGKTTTNTSSSLDKATFKDERYSFDVGLDRRLTATGTRGKIGFSYSKENDYKHIGISTGLSKEINSKNTTLAIGLAYSSDTSSPVGGVPLGLSIKGTTAKIAANKSKKATDIIVGVTQVLSKNTIAQVNYGIGRQTGYLNDPYKLVSVVGNNGKVQHNLHESRPDQRLGHNVYGAIKHSLRNKNVITGTARLHTDDWGIDSLTTELKYRVTLSGRSSIEPYFRFYHQTAADFYASQLGNTERPSHASADYRLSEFSSYTLGATYRIRTSPKREWSVTGEFYKQATDGLKLGDDDDDRISGKTVNNPGYDAFILSVGLKF